TAPYLPTHDLLRIGIEIADLIGADVYVASAPEIGADPAMVWLRGVDDRALDAALAGVRAAATVRGELRPSAHPEASSQSFIVIIVEAANAADARMLLDLSRGTKPADHAMLAIAEGAIFCQVVARAFVLGVESFESTTAL